jgi:PPOX class probable F420-dependent enzyme
MPAVIIDPGTPEGAQALRRLRGDPVLWLTSVSSDGQPQSTPVWFIWEEDRSTILMFSIPTAPKLANIRSNPRVSLHFNDVGGSDVVAIEGTAEITDEPPPATEIPQYIEKYRTLIADIGTEPGPFARLFAQAIRIRPTRLRALWPVES